MERVSSIQSIKKEDRKNNLFRSSFSSIKWSYPLVIFPSNFQCTSLYYGIFILTAKSSIIRELGKREGWLELMFLFDKQFWKFNMVGILNTVNYYILYMIFKEAFQMNYMTSHLLGFFISMIGSFYLNSYFTYRVKPTLKKFLKFPLTYVVNILVSTLVIYILVQLLSISDNIAPIIATIIAIPFTFVISKIILTKE